MPETAGPEETNDGQSIIIHERRTLRITYHAAERFLQRVFQLKDYTKDHILRAKKLIEKDVANLQLRNFKRFPLPSFPQFYGVVVNGSLVTIVPKR